MHFSRSRFVALPDMWVLGPTNSKVRHSFEAKLLMQFIKVGVNDGELRLALFGPFLNLLLMVG